MSHLQPIKKKYIPDYPTRREALADPTLLKNLPERWRHSSRMVAVAGLVASLSLMTTSCFRTVGKIAAPSTPSYLNETDVLSLIGDRMVGILPALKVSYAASDSPKPITYLSLNSSSKTFEEVTLSGSGDSPSIDTFDEQKGVGFEYIGIGTLDRIEKTGNTIEHADSDNAYVLVIPADYSKLDISQDIESFLSWLVAEGILQ